MSSGHAPRSRVECHGPAMRSGHAPRPLTIVSAFLVVLALLTGCESKPKLTMTVEEIVAAVRDYADRGCACETDKECFREVRDEWDGAKRAIVRNANLLTGADRDAYLEERKRFGACGDAAGLTVWDNV